MILQWVVPKIIWGIPQGPDYECLPQIYADLYNNCTQHYVAKVVLVLVLIEWECVKCMYTADEMDTALDTALEMDTVGHELILAWVERGQPTSERGGCGNDRCIERWVWERWMYWEAFLSHPLFWYFVSCENMISSLKFFLYFVCKCTLSDFGLSFRKGCFGVSMACTAAHCSLWIGGILEVWAIIPL